MGVAGGARGGGRRERDSRVGGRREAGGGSDRIGVRFRLSQSSIFPGGGRSPSDPRRFDRSAPRVPSAPPGRAALAALAAGSGRYRAGGVGIASHLGAAGGADGLGLGLGGLLRLLLGRSLTLRAGRGRGGARGGERVSGERRGRGRGGARVGGSSRSRRVRRSRGRRGRVCRPRLGPENGTRWLFARGSIFEGAGRDGRGRTSARTRTATRALVWDFAENFLRVVRDASRGVRRSASRSSRRGASRGARGTAREKDLSASHRRTARPITSRAGNRRGRRARATYPETETRAASWGAAARVKAIAAGVTCGERVRRVLQWSALPRLDRLSSRTRTTRQRVKMQRVISREPMRSRHAGGARRAEVRARRESQTVDRVQRTKPTATQIADSPPAADAKSQTTHLAFGSEREKRPPSRA